MALTYIGKTKIIDFGYGIPMINNGDEAPEPIYEDVYVDLEALSYVAVGPTDVSFVVAGNLQNVTDEAAANLKNMLARSMDESRQLGE